MFNKRLNSEGGSKKNDKPPNISLTQPRPEIIYPPRSKSDGSEKRVEDARKRPVTPSVPETSKKSKSNELPEYSPYTVPTLNQTWFHRSVLKNEDPIVAAQYLQCLGPSPDRQSIDNLPSEQFSNEFNLAASKFMPYFASSVARARVGYIDPDKKKEYNKMKTDLAKSQQKLKKLREESEARNQEHILQVEGLTQKLTDMEMHEGEKIKIAREEGRSEYLLSDEGLKMVDQIRNVQTEAVLYSPDFTNAVEEVSMFYGELIVDRAKDWATQGKPLQEFSIKEGLYDAPDHPRTIPSTSQLEMQKFNARELVEYIRALEKEVSPIEDEADDTLATVYEEMMMETTGDATNSLQE